MKLKHVFLAGTFATAIFLTSCDKDDDTADVSAQDETFSVKASQSNRAEIELGALAVTKATNSGVRTFAQQMVTEHTAAQADLVNVVNDLDTDISLSDSLDAEQVAMRTMLQSLSGAAFDSAYIDGQVKSHTKTLGIFDAEVAGGQNAQVKGYAVNKRPAIAMHLNMADSLYTIVAQ